MSNRNSRKTNQLIPLGCVAGMLLIFGLVYQFLYAPGERRIVENLQAAGHLLEKLENRDEVAGRYELVRDVLKEKLQQQGIENKKNLLMESAEGLVLVLHRSLQSCQAEVTLCTPVPKRESNPADLSTEGVRAEFNCGLPDLFRFLDEADQFPPNVRWKKMTLDESSVQGPCRVRIEFEIDLSHLVNSPVQHRKGSRSP